MTASGLTAPGVTSPGTGWGRLTRAGLLAALTMLISVGGHALAGGAVHLSMPLLIGAAALAALCVVAADVRRSFGEIVAVVLLSQPVLHLLASMGAHGPHAETMPLTVGMAAAHVGAALVGSALLADAERAFWTLAGLFTPVRIPRPAPVCRCAPPAVPTFDDRPSPLLFVALASSVSRRGPPTVVGAH